jgi:hypothetical protein
MTRRSRAPILAFVSTILTYLAASIPAYSQTYYQEHEVQVPNLPLVVSRSDDPSDVLLASLQTLFHDQEICCGRDSALEDSAQAADARSLKEISAKLDGRHLMGDGHPIHIAAEYVTPEAVTASRVVSAITDQHPLLMQWNSHLYVVYGVDYMRTEDLSAGVTATVIRKFLLWDTRCSDERRNVVFNRDTEDPSRVQGILFLQLRVE